ncbi:MAG: hypothetical protein FWB73_00030 [Treponema sp.]|nr:hypothetical protein [Treponema sp.]
MRKDEKQLLDEYRQMTPENRAHLLSLAHATRAAQETTKKAMSKPAAPKTKKRSA